MKKVIRLTEGDLHRIVKKSINRILKESSFDSIRQGGWQEKLQQIHNLALEMEEMAKDESPNGFGETELLTTAQNILKITRRWGCKDEEKKEYTSEEQDEWPEERINQWIDTQANYDDYPV